jgi:6-pyruvoyltetrahydropterin/6-carboxytetrahydropterin synthase
MLFEDGTREPLHGHNYRVRLKIKHQTLANDMVMDFLDIKPLVREICQAHDHKILIPKLSSHIEIFDIEHNFEMRTRDGSIFSFPKQDVLLLPIENSSVERIAYYLGQEIQMAIKNKYQKCFEELWVSVEESPGQAASFCFKSEQ